MAQKDVEMKEATDEEHQKEGDKQKEPDEQQAKKDKDLLAFEGMSLRVEGRRLICDKLIYLGSTCVSKWCTLLQAVTLLVECDVMIYYIYIHIRP